jgi:alpha-tubulin suppressor-like RCC1 family protein
MKAGVMLKSMLAVVLLAATLLIRPLPRVGGASLQLVHADGAPPAALAQSGVSAGAWQHIVAQIRADQAQSGCSECASAPDWSEQKKLLASDGAAEDQFGHSVAIWGDTVVVGARGPDLGRPADQGSAYLFARNQGGADNWGQVIKLTASDGAADDWFGESVAIWGDTVVVGASRADIGGKAEQGSAYVFARNQGGANHWGQVSKLTASDGAAGDYFGESVAICDDTVVVGAPVDDSWHGSAYLFARNQGGVDHWGQIEKLTATDGGGLLEFGLSVAIWEDTVVVGAYGDDIGSNADQGSAYVFGRNQGGVDNWGQIIQLTASDGAAGDNFGESVAICGDTVVVGALWDDIGSNPGQGSAYLFARNQGGADHWGQVSKLTAADGAADNVFGDSVAIWGDAVVVGAGRHNGYRGSAYLFARNEGGADHWGEVAQLTASDGAAGDEFGESVAIWGDTVVGGACRDDTGSNEEQGSAYLFGCTPPTSTPTPTATSTPTDTVTQTATRTATPTGTRTTQPSPTATPTHTVTATPTGTGVATPTPTPTVPPQATPTHTATASPTWPLLLNVEAVDAGPGDTCAVTAGAAKCWGCNSSSRLGDGTNINRSWPVDVFGLQSGVAAIASGDDHTCALMAGGGAKCWGANWYGQLGDGTTAHKSTPVAVLGLQSGAAIGVGLNHNCALTAGGGVKCWGCNGSGRLGDGTTINRSSPVDVVGLGSGVTAVAAGGEYNCALTVSGGVKCWGANWTGELGDGTTTERVTPVDVVGLASGVAAIAGGSHHTCAVTVGGGVKCWGWNEYGQLGDGTTTDSSTPVDVVGLASGVIAVAAGNSHTCALTASGAVKCWGRNYSGELGDGTTSDSSMPVNVVGLAGEVSAITTGWGHTCVLTTAGGVKCWGANGCGQLGDGTTASSTAPVDVVVPLLRVYLPLILRSHDANRSTISDPDRDWLPGAVQLANTDILAASAERRPVDGVVVFTMRLAGNLPHTLAAEERNRWIWLLDTDINAGSGEPWYDIGAEYEVNLHVQWDGFYVDVRDWSNNWRPVPGAGTIDGNMATVRIPVSYLGGASRFDWMVVAEPFERTGTRFDIAPNSGHARLP